jgi:hypothetical protein
MIGEIDEGIVLFDIVAMRCYVGIVVFTINSEINSVAATLWNFFNTINSDVAEFLK